MRRKDKEPWSVIGKYLNERKKIANELSVDSFLPLKTSKASILRVFIYFANKRSDSDSCKSNLATCTVQVWKTIL